MEMYANHAVLIVHFVHLPLIAFNVSLITITIPAVLSARHVRLIVSYAMLLGAFNVNMVTTSTPMYAYRVPPTVSIANHHQCA